MTTLIDSLTPEQQERETWYLKQQIAHTTGPMNKPRLEKLLKKSYAEAKVPFPPVTYIGSPQAARAYIRSKGGDPSALEYLQGAGEEGWVAFCLFGEELTGPVYSEEDRKALKHRRDMLFAACGGWVWCAKEEVVIAEPPLYIKFDADPMESSARLHCATGPAVEFSDGRKKYYYHGLEIHDPTIIENPETITIKRINQEMNAELRRVLVSQFGEGRYLEAVDAEPMDEDEATRSKLYRIRRPNDTDQQILRVENHTLEPDGTRRTFFLKVPNTITKAAAAVRWTFGIEQEATLVNAT